MKRALVLAGGGSKGAYEVGFVRALSELNIDYQIVTGTSIGALNGCLLAQQDFDAMIDLWDHLDISQIFESGFIPNLSFDLDQMMNQSNLAVQFFKDFIKEKGANITPLKNKMAALLKVDALLDSPIDFGLCTVSYPLLKPLFITKKEMEKDHILDYLIASASCFPIFPIHTFLNQSYIDGGYYDNVPVDLAFAMGADEVIVVDMHVQPTHPHYVHRPRVLYTTPSLDLGGFMDFNSESLKRNQRIGYQTAMKYFGKYDGFIYTIENIDYEIFDMYYDDILYLERYMRYEFRNDSSANFLNKFLESHHNEQLQLKDYVYVAMDWILELLSYDPSYVYPYNQLIHDLFSEFQKYMKIDYQMIALGTMEEIVQSFSNIHKKGIVGRLLHEFLYPKDNFDSKIFLKLFPKEFMMARLLVLICRRNAHFSLSSTKFK